MYKRKLKNKDIPFVETSIDNDETNDHFDDNDTIEEDTIDDSEIAKLKSSKRKAENTDLTIPIAKYGNIDIFCSKTMLDDKIKKLDILIKRKSKNQKVKSNTCELNDFENIPDPEVRKSMTERKVKNKNIESFVNVPISNNENHDNSSTTRVLRGRKVIKSTKNDEKQGNNKILVRNNTPITKGAKVLSECINLKRLSEPEMRKRNEERKLKDDYVTAQNRCESCIETFQDCDTLETHISELHEPKPNTIMCNICKVYVESLNWHRQEHYLEYECRVCKESLQFKNSCKRNVAEHLRDKHLMQQTYVNRQMKSLTEKEAQILIRNTEPTTKKNLTILIDDPEGSGFACWQCKKYFKTKNLRKKHLQKAHSEGYLCPSCGKTFPSYHTMRTHELAHCNPRPREKCAVCGKMVRADHVKVHARIHTNRKEYSCTPCNKKFKDRHCYESHLKYSRNHADTDVYKHKCPSCSKGYRSMAELRDHYNYWHMGKTHHKCPICHKALATPRCVTRHIKRAHHGQKEQTKRDKICQTCGKGFLLRKSLTEHELIHTGEKPFSCDICARTFRQKACLYTHRRRVHKVAPKHKPVHTEDVIPMNSEINTNDD